MTSAASRPTSKADHAAPHGNPKGCIFGFILSIMLTLLAFGTVMSGRVSGRLGLTIIVALCVAQLLAQLVFFLHIGSSPDQRVNTAIFICTAALIAIVVAGSLWVMHNANLNMMPMPTSAAQPAERDHSMQIVRRVAAAGVARNVNAQKASASRLMLAPDRHTPCQPARA